MLVIGTPCYGGVVTLPYMLSMLALKDLLNRGKVPFRLLTPANDSLITRVRNGIANEFLRDPRATHLLFIDADIEFQPQMVTRLLASGKDVVCGVYPVKGLPLDRVMGQPAGTPPAVAEAASLDYAVKVKAGCRMDAAGFLEVEYAATGFMMVRREALLRLKDAYPELHYRHDCTNAAATENFAFFDTAIDPVTRDYLPEDYAFCKRWRDIGGQVHVSVPGTFAHHGGRAYVGDFATFLARRGATKNS
uniref:Glycosyltransferase n=1 Tax=Desulfovibrio sp. U5L TaxID=596152 RepID=I2Q242_9BACT